MNGWAIFGKVVTAAVVVTAVGFAAASLPSLKRYIKIRQM